MPMTKQQKLNKDSLRQRNERLDIKPPVGYTVDDFRIPFGKDPLKGIIHILKNYKTANVLFMEKMTLYGNRRLTEIIIKINKGCSKDIISAPGVVKHNKSHRHLYDYILDDKYKSWTVDQLHTHILDLVCKTSNNMTINQSEIQTGAILERIVPNWFIYKGCDRTYKICNLTPDFVDEKRGIVVNFDGPKHFAPFNKDPNYEVHVLNTQHRYNKAGYMFFAISYKDLTSSFTQKKMENHLINFLKEHMDRDLQKEIQKIKDKPFLKVL